MKIFEAAELIERGQISPKELLSEVWKNIENGKEKRAYVTLCDDIEVPQKVKGEKKSPLWGIPIAVKDNICTKGILTTAGSKMLSGFVPPYDAHVVKRLKENGAVIVGKTNMDEFGMGSEGVFSAFGKMENPIRKGYVAGGSSSGSAIAVKMRMALGALGSDTGGSVRQPAAFCNLYGLKPTYSLLSRYGLIAFASSLDTVGIIGQCTRDVAIMLDATAGFDRRDAKSADKGEGNYYRELKNDVRGKRIGIIKEMTEASECDIKAVINSAAKGFEEMGAEVEECSVPSLKYAVSAYYIISSAEASSNLARYDGVRYGKRGSDTENFEKAVISTRSENFGSEVKKRIVLGTYVLSSGYYDLYYMKAKKAQRLIEKELESLFEKYDLLISPTCPVGVWEFGKSKDCTAVYKNDLCTIAASLAGNPAMSVPAGKDKNDMPVGMQIIGKKFAEKEILCAAQAFEEGHYGI